MPELGTYGSVRGAAGNSRPYRKRRVGDGAAHSVKTASEKPATRSAVTVAADAGRSVTPKGSEAQLLQHRPRAPFGERPALL